MKLFSAPSSDEWFFLGIVFFLVVMMIAIAELVRRLMNGNSEYTRKFVHIVVGILMAFAPAIFSSGIPAIAISLTAIAGTFFSIRLGIFKSLHVTERVSYGTTFHPLAFLILVLLFWDRSPDILSISILILAIPDALAAIIGKHLRSAHIFSFSADKKTVEGSAVMFVSTAGLLFIFLWYGSYETHFSWVSIAVVTALVVTAWELICSKGLDNLTIPLSTAFMLQFLLVKDSGHISVQLMTAIVLSFSIGLLSYYFKFLSASGSIATFLLATIIYGIGGWMWTTPILTFFIASSLVSKYGKGRKKKFEQIFDKTDLRDAGQVAANGGIAGIIILLSLLFPGRMEIYYCFVASIAAVTADTWGTEIGTLMKGKPRSIISFQAVEVGTSGGVSLAGLLGGCIGASLVVLSSVAMNSAIFTRLLIIQLVFSGFIGSLVDSVLGSTIQAQYQTNEGRRTEKIMVNGIPTTLVSGYSFINNDKVNWFCALSGAVTMYFLL